jgi:GNAT superfamily N-acetyltransferase
MDFRPFVENDREALRHVYLESRRGTFTWLESSTLSLSDFDRDTAGEKIWVAVDCDLVVGFVSVDEKENFVHNLFVSTKWLGRGVGSQLLEISLASLGRPARLKCVAANTKALSFYHGKGWYKVCEGVSEDGLYYVLERG